MIWTLPGGHRVEKEGEELRFLDHSPEEATAWLLGAEEPGCLCPAVYRAWVGASPRFWRTLWFALLPGELRELLAKRALARERGKRASA